MTDCCSRSTAADACLAMLDAAFFKALCDPSRLEVVRALIRLGRADIAAIAAETRPETPLDRSVISRHLQVLERAGIAIGRKQGRHVYFELDGPAILGRLRQMTAALAPIAPLCCPGSSSGSSTLPALPLPHAEGALDDR